MKKTIQAKTKTTRMRVSTQLIQQLSSTFYPKIRMVFEELIVNSRDAMASVVRLHIGENKIIIQDDGEGMLPEELEKYFYISYSEKSTAEIKARGDIKRIIIGKFGIGKLSLYRICNRIDVETWRDGIVSRASFNFRDFESLMFIEEFELEVEVGPDEGHETDSGTKITLYDLKKKNFDQPFNAMYAKRFFMKGMQKTIPLGHDIEITISGEGLSSPITLKPEEIIEGDISNLYEIDETIKQLGRVWGRIAYLEHGTIDSGIYVRVLGRIVNYDNPKGLVDIADLSHAQMFQRRIIAEINADCLNEALQTNRSGFIEDNNKFKIFHKWLRKVIRHYNEKEYKKWEEIRKKIETQEIPKAISDFIKTSLEGTKSIKKARMDFKIEVRPLGVTEPEARFDKRTNTIIINSTHPMYAFSRKKGKTWGMLYHSLKAAIVFFASGTSKNIKDFERIYNEITIESEEKVKKIKIRRLRAGKPRKKRKR